ncbi:MAG: L,D-transpeptidase family protein [Lysobacterales bacterium]
MRTAVSIARILLLGWISLPLMATEVPSSARAVQAEQRVRADLDARLAMFGARWGAPLYLRIFKQSRELELWVRAGEGYQLFQTWPICTWSGSLGPKLQQGDWQAPEGFYTVAARQLNPVSRFHLAFNLGYPNAYDRAHGRTGDFLMVHGNCVSVGCYAMGDAAIEQIYTLVAAALAAGQKSVPVHIFPFRMDGDWASAYADHEWLPFWRELEPAYRGFVAGGTPPKVRVQGKRYVVE